MRHLDVDRRLLALVVFMCAVLQQDVYIPDGVVTDASSVQGLSCRLHNLIYHCYITVEGSPALDSVHLPHPHCIICINQMFDAIMNSFVPCA